ncbi:hypothetical protein KKC91_03475 [bacterium]|nr:hypothetical protein [bacterium]
MSSNKSVSLNFLIFVVALIITLFVIEFILRTIDFPKGATAIRMYSWNYKGQYLDLTAGFRGKVYNTDCSINKYGMRNVDFPLRKPQGTIRILGLGDSWTFGMWVEERNTYLRKLESILRRKNPAQSIQVINAGICSLNTEQTGKLVIDKKLMKFSPDIVMINVGPYCAESGIPDSAFRKNRFLVRAKEIYSDCFPYTYSFIKLRLERTRKFGFIKKDVSREKDIRLLKQAYMEKLYKDENTGLMELKKAIKKLDAIANESNSNLVVLIFPILEDLKDYKYEYAHKKISMFCRRNNIKYIDFLPEFLGKDERELWASEDDHHPNKLGHQIIAEALYECLISDSKF